MKLQLLDKLYLIKFHHNNTHVNRYTTATLYEVSSFKNPSEKTVVYTATAFCSEKDNFNRSIGRKLALTRLLKWMSTSRFEFNKTDRAAIWSAYFSEHNS